MAVEELPEIVVPEPDEPDQGGGAPGTGGRSGDPDDSNQGPPSLPSPDGQPAAPRRASFPYLERAVLLIDGVAYWEWESVQVRLAIEENPANTFRFTASENEPQGQSWAAQRIIPGQKCQVILDGYIAITGEVVTRQVYYDAKQHHVEIQGQGETGRMGDSALVSETSNWKNIDFNQLANIAASQFGLGVSGKSISEFKFPRVATMPGETAWEIVERYARAANTPLGETSTGQLQLGLQGGSGARLVEGVNIISGREVIRSLPGVGGESQATGGAGSDYKSVAQGPGNDDEWGAKTVHQRWFESPAITTTFNKGFNAKVALGEIPGWGKSMMQSRAKMEANVSDGFSIKVTIAAIGWQRNAAVPPAGGLWRPGEDIVVHSPMLVMYNRTLTLKAVTFSQDNDTGTRSTLELWNWEALHGEIKMTGGGGGGGGGGGEE